MQTCSGPVRLEKCKCRPAEEKGGETILPQHDEATGPGVSVSLESKDLKTLEVEVKKFVGLQNCLTAVILFGDKVK